VKESEYEPEDGEDDADDAERGARYEPPSAIGGFGLVCPPFQFTYAGLVVVVLLIDRVLELAYLAAEMLNVADEADDKVVVGLVFG
jgi:hypothetical protein